jgi:hypothetical protein
MCLVEDRFTVAVQAFVNLLERTIPGAKGKNEQDAGMQT